MSGRAATAAVAGRIRAVATTASVWDTLDNVTDPKLFMARYKSAGIIHAWEITREGSEPVETESASAIKRRERVIAYGYYAYSAKGDSEPAFQAEIDALCEAFDPPSKRQFTDVAGADPSIEWSLAPMVDGPRLGKLGDYLVHYVKLTIIVEFDPIY